MLQEVRNKVCTAPPLPKPNRFGINPREFAFTTTPPERERLFNQSQWIIEYDHYSPSEQPGREPILSLSNGEIDIRGSLGRHNGRTHNWATFKEGLFDSRPDDVDDSPNLPHFLLTGFNNGYETFDIDKSKVEKFKARLDLKHNIVSYEIGWVDSQGRETDINITQFASTTNKNVVGIRYAVVPKNYEGAGKFDFGFDGRVDNACQSNLARQKYLEPLEIGTFSETGLIYDAKTVFSGGRVAEASNFELTVKEANGQTRQVDQIPAIIKEEECITQEVEVDLKQGQEAILTRLISIASSTEARDENPRDFAERQVQDPGQFDALLEAHKSEWEKFWETADIEIDGDPRLQQAVRAGILKYYSLVSANPRKILPPKGAEKPGVSYKKHGFWESDVTADVLGKDFLDAAYAHLEYRHNSLPAARQKAIALGQEDGKAEGYKGAALAWESSDDGSEQCPKVVYDKYGNVIIVRNGTHELHVNNAAALFIHKLYLITGGENILKEKGGEMLVEFARFWASRASLDETDNKYHIDHVTGPDEFHEDVRDNAYTNITARWNLRYAAKLSPELFARMGVGREEIEGWNEVAEEMYIPLKEDHLEQHKGFFDLNYIDLKTSRYKGVHGMDSALKNEGKDMARFAVVKQDDVIKVLNLAMDMPELLPELNAEELRKLAENDFELYNSITSHGSSLSKPGHAQAAYRLGKLDEADKYLEDAAFIDLENRQGNTPEGTHVGCEALTIQALIYGAGGVSIREHYLGIDPKLSPKVKGLKFRVRYMGQILELRETGRMVEVTALPQEAQKEVSLRVYGGDGIVKIKTGEMMTFFKQNEEQFNMNGEVRFNNDYALTA